MTLPGKPKARQGEKHMITDLLIITIFPLAMALAAATDLFSMTVPNWISLLLVAGFAVLAPLVGIGWSEAGLHVALALGALILTFAMFSLGWIGGGDAKLFAATCLWLGPEQMLLRGLRGFDRRRLDAADPVPSVRVAPGHALLARLAHAAA